MTAPNTRQRVARAVAAAPVVLALVLGASACGGDAEQTPGQSPEQTQDSGNEGDGGDDDGEDHGDDGGEQDDRDDGDDGDDDEGGQDDDMR